MIVLAIDPGPEQSALAVFNTEAANPVRVFCKLGNQALLAEINDGKHNAAARMAIEMIASYGMAVGREVFETCVWIGRFVEAWSGEHAFVYRGDVKLHLCGSMRAKDANVRAALIDRFGPGKSKAVGTKGKPGPLYGMAGDVWSALAVAVTYADGAANRAPTERVSHPMANCDPRE